ncbi:hypothetical protein [Nonomuraea sp. NPDC049400]|uniref:hypothetical protein n=1 Tax=Nonomuraea sp. NPDC049400 TaxID=3364352 RepID=UPI0037B60F84
MLLLLVLGSKAALRELADSLREEEAAHGIRVTTVNSAATATDLLGEVRSAFGRPYDPELCIRTVPSVQVAVPANVVEEIGNYGAHSAGAGSAPARTPGPAARRVLGRCGA